jgi:hypothetical protein
LTEVDDADGEDLEMSLNDSKEESKGDRAGKIINER